MGAQEITITVSCSTKDGAFQVPVKLLRPLTRSIDTDPSSLGTSVFVFVYFSCST